MHTTTNTAATNNNHKETAPAVYTSYQVELMITAAINKVTLEIIENTNREALLFILDVLAEVKSTRPEMFILHPGDLNYWQWKEAALEKACYYPELLTQDEAEIAYIIQA